MPCRRLDCRAEKFRHAKRALKSDSADNELKPWMRRPAGAGRRLSSRARPCRRVGTPISSGKGLCKPLSRSTACRGHAGREGQEKGGIGAVEKLFLLPVSLAGAAAAVACRSRIMKLVPPKAMSAMSSAER